MCSLSQSQSASVRSVTRVARGRRELAGGLVDVAEDVHPWTGPRDGGAQVVAADPKAEGHAVGDAAGWSVRDQQVEPVGDPSPALRERRPAI